MSSENKNMATSILPHELEDPQLQENVQPEVRGSENIEIEEISGHDEAGALPTVESGSWDPKKYMSLYKAAQKGDWKFAKKLFQDDPNAKTAKVTNLSEMAIHVAATAGRSEFVVELVKIMPPESLEFKETKNGETLLHLAAISGIIKAAKAIVEVNPHLTQICNNSGWVPLLSAASHVSTSSNERQKKMVEYLYSVTRQENPSHFEGNLGATLLCALIKAGFYDIALSLVEQYPDLAIEADKDGIYALEVLAETPTAFRSGVVLTPIERDIYNGCQVKLPSTSQERHYVIKGDAEDPPEIFGELSSKQVMANALNMTSMTQVLVAKILPGYQKILKTKRALDLVKCILARISQMPNSDISDFFMKHGIVSKFTMSGISEFIVECLETFPLETNKQEILKVAVEQRHDNIFRLIHENNVDQKLLSFQDESGNTILHLAAKIAPMSYLKKFGGEVFQMQEELRWFKAVESIVLDIDKSRRNNDKMTAYELFTKEHKDLMQKAEESAKKTAESSMLVASLVATVVFAAAITVPGGNVSDSDDKNNGTPIFIREKAFLIFVVADAVAFFCSIISAMMFITVLTSRYSETDFLVSLPQKIILNLAALSLSIFAMMVTFSAALNLMLVPRFSGAIVPVTLLASTPIFLFGCLLLLPLLIKMVRLTYRQWETRGEGSSL